ncbi:hypothetical protein SEA_ESTES_169 [Mycobacterium phage Estes]|uniref:Uncharacterized protein n=1 Tax=Mycobacterium phage Estes TaxID=2759459 RepID=A0A7G9A2L8_9CAUD|nr:hypothetical protein J4U03_gp106 [Mycobacterium phage Estes]QNL30857.1 hypothetical protein SEA_ESTES_169 [Mycobacterium phage Estes]
MTIEQPGEILRRGDVYATVLPYSTQGHGVHKDTYRWAVYVVGSHGAALMADGVKHRRGDAPAAEREATRAATAEFKTWSERINGY